MGLGSERASNQVCLWKAPWDGAKERHTSIVVLEFALNFEGESRKALMQN